MTKLWGVWPGFNSQQRYGFFTCYDVQNT